jgi:hypothetical protein
MSTTVKILKNSFNNYASQLNDCRTASEIFDKTACTKGSAYIIIR